MLIGGKQSPDHMALAPSFLTYMGYYKREIIVEKLVIQKKYALVQGGKVCVPNGQNWKKQ